MRIGLVLPTRSSDPERVLTFARRAEELGFDGLFASDHLFPPGAAADRPSLEAYAVLAAVGASTNRVTIGTLVTRASLRSAGLIAKQASTLDDVSDGRFVLGIGSGDEVSRREHEAFGIPYLGPEVRRQHLRETVRAVRALFRGEPFAGGELVPAIEGPLLPAPRRAGGPPIWIGGVSDGAVRLAAREADGWNGWELDLPAFGSRVDLLRGEAGGRDIEPTWAGRLVVGRDMAEAEQVDLGRRRPGDAWRGDVAAAAHLLSRLAEAGAAWAIVQPAGGPDRMELIGERVLPRVAARTP